MSQSATLNGWPRSALNHLLASASALVTLVTTHWLKQSTGFTRPKSFTAKVHGRIDDVELATLK